MPTAYDCLTLVNTLTSFQLCDVQRCKVVMLVTWPRDVGMLALSYTWLLRLLHAVYTAF
jgi:hypothetical protein